MNKVYQIIWNNTLGQWVIASELSRGKKKSGRAISRNHVAAVVFGGLSSLLSLDANSTDYNAQISVSNGQTLTLQPGDTLTPPLITNAQGAVNASGLGTLLNVDGTIMTVSTGPSRAGHYEVAMLLDNGAAANINQTSIALTSSDNSADIARILNGSKASFTDSNLTSSGGGIWVINSELNMNNSNIESTGNAISGSNNSTVSLTDVQINLNGTGLASTQAISMMNANSLTMTNVKITDARDYSSAIYTNANTNHIDKSNIIMNGNGTDGIVFDSGLNLFLTDTNITSNGDTSMGLISANGESEVRGGTITGLGSQSVGISVQNPSFNPYDTASNTSVILKATGTRVEMYGDISIGVSAERGTITELNDSDIITHGKANLAYGDSAGIFVIGNNIADATYMTINNSRISTSGDGTMGLLTGYGAGTVLNGGTVTTSGTKAAAIRAYTYGADGKLIVNDTLIETQGDEGSVGVSVNGVAQAQLNNAVIKTAGQNSFGLSANSLYFDHAYGYDIYAEALGAGIEANNVQIQTTGVSGHGVSVSDGNSIVLKDSSIHTQGANAYGLQAHSDVGSLQSDNNPAQITANNITILTEGNDASGVVGVAQGANVNAVLVELNGGTIETRGASASGLSAEGDTDSKVNINGSNIQVLTTGAGASGLSVKDGSIDLKSSTVKATQGNGINALMNSEVNLTDSEVTGGNGIGINVDGASAFAFNANNSVLNGDVLVASDSSTDMTLSNNSTMTGAAHGVTNLNLTDSRWNMTDSSDVGLLNINQSTISFSPPVSGNFKTLSVNSLNGNNGTFVLNTVLNEGGANTQSDKVHVTGDASGDHNLLVNNVGGLGALTVGDGIQVVQIDGNESGAFKLGNTVSAGAYQYNLYQGGVTGANDWYLRSYLEPTPPPAPEPDPIPAPESGLTPVPELDPTPAPVPTPAHTISYRPEVPGYVAAPYLNEQYGFDTIGTMHERIGDNVVRNTGSAWGRIGGQHIENESGSFSYDTDTWFAQLGADLYQATNEAQTEITSGIMLTLGQQNTDANDSSRSLNPTLSTQTGTVDTHGYGLGAYYTRMAQDGSYLDLVTQGTYYRNDYSSDHNAKQDGYGLAFSAETGKPFDTGNNWSIEPQAQVMYQYLSMNSFNDDVSHVDGTSHNSVRARGGLRITKQMDTMMPYVLMDVIHTITDSPDVRVANTTMTSDFDKTWWQIGSGVSAKISDNASLYGDVKYQKSFSSNVDGYSGHLGIKVNF
ncbi:autotransporter outer membrane beta-barrel domain-containing protein [Budviciaceae bacterium BWR-B9]|uniref:Autotransporter outer membrane beta-barrel domain-containing protein n=1 Tax=Limnobaculum allomyrinae TaxID=2791986 RepID=A0ABS1IN24_9GAMM|nr:MULTISPECIES: autotransporter outer membrane beta-barrel domain-containing protein [Limnobaculum]MBK5142921.1 autotransporter outer membrane beta-barrel domain-containing protein [Limnobaculum allomyrinae]MBV7690192.1 autotransporter outer membrane beta-barrel domain-containing protein [Limnobaculum sp. M2-1]